MNSKNNVYWGTSPPVEVAERLLHSCMITAWVAISSRGIIAPFFFERNGVTVTVNSERYVEVLDKFWIELQRRFNSTLNRQWFQQDGATPHTANVSIEWLKQHFEERIVSRRCQIEWPPYSPDLSPRDFYMWGYLKNKVYEEKPRDLNQLKEKIKDEINAIKGPVLKAVMQNLTLRI